MVTAQERLNQILPSWYDLLTQWSQDGTLVAAATDALMLDSSNAKPDAKGQLQSLTSQWAAGNFKSLPEIVLLSNADISGAQGAYAASTGKIYLNADWLLTADQEWIQRVLTEELGHSLDAQLNLMDTQGDEGEYFSGLLGGTAFDKATVIRLRTEDDTDLLPSINGDIGVEFSTIPSGANYLDGNWWYWDGYVPSTYYVQRLQYDPILSPYAQDKIWFFGDPQYYGYLTRVGVGVTHDYLMISDLSDGVWSAGTDPIVKTNGILISTSLWEAFTSSLPKDANGNLVTITGLVLGAGAAKMHDLVWTLEAYGNWDIDLDGIVGIQNIAPTDLSLTSSGILENSAAGTVIGALAATDPDANSTFTYALVAGNGSNDADNSLVEIIGNQVKVKSGASIDYETNPVLNINVQVTDNGGLTFTKALTAAVTNAQEGGGIGTLTSNTFNSLAFVEGVTLTAGAITDPDGITGQVTYNWFNGVTLVQSGLSDTYKVGDQGLGTYRVEATYQDGTGSLVTAVSANQVVGKANNSSATFQVLGTAAVGATLTASKLTNDADGNGTFSYQWQSFDGTWSNIGTDLDTYTVTSADQGKQLRVTISYQDGQNYNESISLAAGNVTVIDDTFTATGAGNTLDGGVGFDRLIYSGNQNNITVSGSINASKIENITSVKSGKTTTTSVTSLASLSDIESIQIDGGISNNVINAGGGTTLGQTRSAFSGTLIANGGAGVDTITGGSYKNWLAGRGFASGVISGVETITGTTNTANGAMDVFDLRKDGLTGAAYVGGGSADYAKVANFNVGTDQLVLTGQASDYKFVFTQVFSGGKVRTVSDEYWAVSTAGGDLIAQVRGTGLNTIAGFDPNTAVRYGTGDQTTFGLGF